MHPAHVALLALAAAAVFWGSYAVCAVVGERCKRNWVRRWDR